MAILYQDEHPEGSFRQKRRDLKRKKEDLYKGCVHLMRSSAFWSCSIWRIKCQGSRDTSFQKAARAALVFPCSCTTQEMVPFESRQILHWEIDPSYMHGAQWRD